MADDVKVDILLVDDRAENLLALEEVLADPSLNIVTANSGNEALARLVKQDFAVVLIKNFPLIWKHPFSHSLLCFINTCFQEPSS